MDWTGVEYGKTESGGGHGVKMGEYDNEVLIVDTFVYFPLADSENISGIMNVYPEIGGKDTRSRESGSLCEFKNIREKRTDDRD